MDQDNSHVCHKTSELGLVPGLIEISGRFLFYRHMDTVIFEKGGERKTLTLEAETLEAELKSIIGACPTIKEQYEVGLKAGLTHEEMIRVLLISAISFRLNFEDFLKPSRIVVTKKKTV